jgi:hypothetical protein
MAKRQPRVKSPKDFVENEAFEKLIRRGVPRDVLLSLVGSIPGASNKKLELVDGIKERTLRKLPDQIDALADKIKKVNESPWLASDGLRRLAHSVHPHESPAPRDSPTTRESAEGMAKYFFMIPGGLHLYAEHLRAWLNRYHPVGSHGTDRIQMQTLLTIKLLILVRDSTGRPRYEEVATLLDAAYRARRKPRTIDAEHLRHLEKNNPRLHLIARFLDAGPQNLR